MAKHAKKQTNLQDIIGFEPLYESMMKCKRGVIWKDSVASFWLNGVSRCIKLSDELKNGSYVPRPTVRFKISSPKPREIASITFRDRVYQRSLNDNDVYPTMSRAFILDNYACQKGKGTDAARNRLAEYMHRAYRKYGTELYVAQLDVSGYYQNMDHEVAEETFRKKLSKMSFRRVRKILRQQYDGDKGYNAGSQLVQIAGISVLDPLDHFIKEVLRAKYYVRYMDDFMIISNDAGYLEYCVKEIRRFLGTLKLEINEKKTGVHHIRDGIPFLGFQFKLTESGKVLRLLLSDNVRRARRKFRRLVMKSKRGEIPREKVNESYNAWKAHAGKGNTYKIIQRMDNYYKNLWKGTE